MFNLFVTHSFGTYGKPTPESQFADLETAISEAFNRIAEIVPDCSVWIETDKGEKLALMN